MLGLFEKVFGHKLKNQMPQEDPSMFWDRCMVVFTKMDMSKRGINRRLSAQQNLPDEKVLEGNLKDLAHRFNVKLDKYVMIDALAPQEGDKDELKVFEIETEKMYSALKTQTPARTKAMTMAYYKFGAEKEKLKHDVRAAIKQKEHMQKEVKIKRCVSDRTMERPSLMVRRPIYDYRRFTQEAHFIITNERETPEKWKSLVDFDSKEIQLEKNTLPDLHKKVFRRASFDLTKK